MDPNANLDEQIELAERAQEIQDNCSDCGEYTDSQLEELGEIATRQAELVLAMNTWIAGGGFLPAAWRRNRK